MKATIGRVRYYTERLGGKLYLCSNQHNIKLCTPHARRIARKMNFAIIKMCLLKKIEKLIFFVYCLVFTCIV